MSVQLETRPPAPHEGDPVAPRAITASRRLRTFLEGWGRNAPVIILGLLLVLLIGAPLVSLVHMSISSGTPGAPGGLTTSNYKAVFNSGQLWSASRNTVVFAGAVSLIGLTIAMYFAWLIERTDMPFRNAAWVAMLLPLAMPGILYSLSWVLLLSPKSGLVNVAVRDGLSVFGAHPTSGPFNAYTLPGMIFVESLRHVPTLFLMVVGAFRLTDPSLEEAAVMSGTSRFSAIRRITLPLLTPALFGAFVFSFVGTLQDFETPLLLGLPGGVFTIPTLIYFTAYDTPSPSWGIASSYACLFLVVLVLLAIWYARVVIFGSKRFASVTGKGFRPTRLPLGRWRYVAAGSFGLFFLVALLLPLLVLIWASILPVYTAPSRAAFKTLTMSNYTSLLHDGQTIPAFEHTLVIAVATAAIVVVLGFITSWLVIRMKARGRGFLDVMAFLPNAIPAVALGIAIIVCYLNPGLRWIPIYGSVGLLIIAFVAHYLAYATRLSNGAMAQIGADLEEAAWVAGRGRMSTLVRITGPLLLPSLLAGALWVMMSAFRNLTLPLLVGSPQTETLSMRLYEIWNRSSDLSLASALGVCLIVILSLLAYGARRLIVGGTVN